MKTESIDIFFKEAKNRFGEDNIHIGKLGLPENTISYLNNISEVQYTTEDIEKMVDAYGLVITVRDNLCPNCGKSLLLEFQWSFEHGVGFCGWCHKTRYRLYHYIGLKRKLSMNNVSCDIPVLQYCLEGFD